MINHDLQYVGLRTAKTHCTQIIHYIFTAQPILLIMKPRLALFTFLLAMVIVPRGLSAGVDVFNLLEVEGGGGNFYQIGQGVPIAQRFTTSADGPLTLTGLTLMSNWVTQGIWNPLVTIQTSQTSQPSTFDDNRSEPGPTVVGSLTSDAGPLHEDEPHSVAVKYDFSGVIQLASNTTYWVVVATNDDAPVYLNLTAPVTSGGSGQWLGSADYGAKYLAYPYGSPVWIPTSQNQSLQMSLTATTTSVPEPATYGLLAGFAALGLVGCRRRARS
jgi:PEP-CTERM motif